MKNRLSAYWDRGRAALMSEGTARFDLAEYLKGDDLANERLVRAGFAAKARRFLARLPMASEAVALYFCLLDGRTPAWVKGVAAAALAYFLLPMDAVPDVLPVIGLGDDASVLAAALTAVTAWIKPEHRAQARAWMDAEQITPVVES